jgi:poly(A) polymerase
VRDALRAGIPGLATLSAERVWSELRRILDAPDPGATVALMAELGVLGAVIPEGADPAALARLIAAGAPAGGLLRLAAMLTGDVEHFADRLKLSGAERQRLLDLRAAPLARPEVDDAALRRLLADYDRALLIDRTWLIDGTGLIDRTGLVADALAGAAQPDWTALRARLAGLPKPVFPLQGSDVLALGVPPGPRVGALLRAVRDWWVAGGCTAGVAECRAELARASGRPLASG